MKMKISKLLRKATARPWKYHYVSAKQARVETDDGTDGGGASGSIYAPGQSRLFPGKAESTIAMLPHHRDENEDIERECNAALIAHMANTYEEILDALAALAECSKCQNGCASDDMTCASNMARVALKKAQNVRTIS